MDQLEYTFESSAVVSTVRRRKTRSYYYVTKRFLDIGLCVLAALITLPLMPIVMLAVMIDSPGPIIYKQERLGKNGKPFIIYKFRSMFMDAEKNGATWAQTNDPRITRVGKLLRCLRLDELPQILNILKGEMSIVGPRPERELFYDKFSNELPEFRDRLKVMPGLTGWAQVNGGYELSPEQKLQFDLYYINQMNMLLDLKCIIYTIRVVLRKEGVR